jgi:hypothetical protein
MYYYMMKIVYILSCISYIICMFMHCYRLCIIAFRVEIEPSEQEEVETDQEPMIDNPSFENQGRHLSILSPYFGSIGVYMSCVCMSNIYVYDWLAPT